MKVNPFVYGLLIVVLFFGVLGAAKAVGVWSLSGKLDASGEKIQPTGASVDEIKGWMTLDEVATAYTVPLAEILAAFELPVDTPGATQLKSLESELFSVSNLRTWLEARPSQQ
jgi:hypothetical protein